MNDLQNMTCPECKTNEGITWHSHIMPVRGAPQDGQLRTHDMKPMFYIGCDFCSETLGVVDASTVAAILTERSRAAGGSH